MSDQETISECEPRQASTDSDSGEQEEHGQPSSLKRKHSDDEESADVPRADNHTTVVASHYNQLKELGRGARYRTKIFYMRNFNNWIKSVLISKYVNQIRDKLRWGSPLRVMDMCCGKGGDLLKWANGNITHLICTDIAEISVQQCEERYQAMRQRPDNSKLFTAEFFAADATLQRLREKYKDPSIDLNLVSCQFAFHYCFESLKQAKFMLKNAAECLKTDGYFIGTIPDAYEIMKRQRQAGSDSFGNDRYKITFLCDTEHPPLFGAKYNFQLDGVVDCPEFLVHFPTLVKLARKHGLKLIECKRFGEVFDEFEKVGSCKTLMRQMQGLETFPGNSRDDYDRQQNKNEYQHAHEFVDQRTSRRGPIGTLSKSDWEVSTLYIYFAFQKVATSWNKNGEPVYD
ncbi:mRNA cap guanine-N7 methyltransferase [Uranotaenia lowii]|uniref:mRNA cap guanine-N7 methyltransferase n=1 Tax=Uranotaenia lowii TaxID=190385 RepID=UPI00247AB702|nr:mRNA cap guanine-N7 methyltransferase [Uranotaenia lowii]